MFDDFGSNFDAGSYGQYWGSSDPGPLGGGGDVSFGLPDTGGYGQYWGYDGGSGLGDWYDDSGLGLGDWYNDSGALDGFFDDYGAVQDDGYGAPGTMTEQQARELMQGPAETPERQNSLLKALGFASTADGTATDFSDPKSLSALMKVLGVGGNFLSKALQGRRNQQQQSNVLQQALAAQARQTWTPQQAAVVNNFLNSGYTPTSQRQLQYAAQAPSSIVPGRGYAGGGEVALAHGGGPAEEVTAETDGPLAGSWEELQRPQGYIDGPTGGQDDVVPANLGHGEYVLDAELVSMLGDGNNAAGAAKLDRWREEIRRHKRDVPDNKIPPKAKAPGQYLKGVK